MIHISTDQLDQASLDYLARIERRSGSAADGVFIRRPGITPSPRVAQVLLLLLGLAALGVSLGAYALHDFQHDDPPALDHAQAALLAAGVGLALGGMMALRRPVFRSPVGHFLWADARFLWQVSPQSIRIWPVEDLEQVRATHVHKEGYYDHTDVLVRMRGDFKQWTVTSRRQAEELVMFLNILLMLRQKEGGVPGELLAAVPELLGSLAMRVVQNGPEQLARGIAITDLEPGLPIPQPRQVTSRLAASQASVVGRLAPWGLAAALALVGLLGLPMINGGLREQRLFARTAQVPPGVEGPYHLYLKAYPDGAHAGQVRATYENNLYEFAQASPAGEERRYRRYLEVFPAGAHADQVRQRFEEDVFQRVATAAAGDEKPYRHYESLFAMGPRIDQVRAAFEGNQYQYALASPPGEESRYRRYLEQFPTHPHAETVRTRYEDNLYQQTVTAPLGQVGAFGRYLDVFPRGRFVEQVRTGWENNLYRLATTGTDENACQPYLRAYPNGKYAAEVADLVDDRRFARASAIARRESSPTSLRGYLANPANQRHRTEAQGQINALYDVAIADLKKRAADSRNKIDQSLFDVMSSLLEGLKTTQSSVVTVGFKASQIDEPQNEGLKAVEKLLYQSYLTQFTELRDLEKSAGTAILPRGQAFDPDRTVRREALIRDRLQTAVARVLKPDLLQLAAASPGQEPMIAVAYEVFPSGSLFVFQQTVVETRNGVEVSRRTRARGLLRGYHIRWTIQVQVPGMEKPRECQFTSNPAESLRYHENPGDPAWAPYAILLYSAFYDMSNRFIRSFALDPGPVPDGFNFKETTGIEVPRRPYGYDPDE